MESAVRDYPNILSLNERLNATNGRLNEALTTVANREKLFGLGATTQGPEAASLSTGENNH
jgi:hypothetical protein